MSNQHSHAEIHAHTFKSLFVTGFFMGIAEAVTGVSGASIAFVAGIYTELINAVKELNPIQIVQLIKNQLLFYKRESGEKRMHLSDTQGLPFLLPLFFGMILAMFVASFTISFLLVWYPQQTNSLFFGIMLTAVLAPIFAIPKKACLPWLVVIFFAWLAYGLVVLPPLNMGGSLYFTFFSGVLAVCAAILPGISGTVLLQALGIYELITNNFYQALQLQMDAFFLILVFCAGVILGITSFVRILSSVFYFYRTYAFAGLTGMMLGALRAVWPFQDAQTHFFYFPCSFHVPEFVCLVLFLTGVLLTSVFFCFNKRFF
jgi:putative membrane protein